MQNISSFDHDYWRLKMKIIDDFTLLFSTRSSRPHMFYEQLSQNVQENFFL